MENAPNPFEAWGLDIRFVEWHELEKTASCMDPHCPRLTDAEIERIAQLVAAYLVEDVLPQVPESERDLWRERFRSTAYDLAVGLATSGIFSLLVYVAHLVDYLAPDEKDEAFLERERQRDRIRSELAKDLSLTSRQDLLASQYQVRDEVLRCVIDTVVRGFDEDIRTRDYRKYRSIAWENAVTAFQGTKPESSEADTHARSVGWQVREAALRLVGRLVHESSRKVLEG